VPTTQHDDHHDDAAGSNVRTHHRAAHDGAPDHDAADHITDDHDRTRAVANHIHASLGCAAVDNIAVIQTIYEAFGRGDVPTILDQLADDVVWDQDAPGYDIPIDEPGPGKAHVQQFFGALQGLEFLRFEPTNFLAGGNQVAVPINLEVKVKDTGKVISTLEMHLWTIGDDAKVARFFHAVDRHAFVLGYEL
jgi:ketosteroid isomerase-like protein